MTIRARNLRRYFIRTTFQSACGESVPGADSSRIPTKIPTVAEGSAGIQTADCATRAAR